MSAPAFVPLVLQDLDLGDRAAPLPRATDDGDALLLVRTHGWPVGQVRVHHVPTAADHGAWLTAVRRADPAVAALAQGVPTAAGGHPAPAPADGTDFPADGVAVVVATLGRTPLLERVVRAVLDQDGPLDRLVVVDNDPASGGAARLLAGIDDPRLTIVPERRRGVSRARNTGLAHVREPVVAFTDDDAVPDRDWTRRTLEAFASDARVACVTGLVVPAELATREQAWFEEFGGFEKGYRAAAWAPGGPDADLLAALDAVARAAGSPQPAVAGRQGAAFPYTAGEFGSGNSMAFRTDALRAVGGFDVALGPGTPTLGGEDLDVFRAIFLGGGAIVYHPRAVVRHHHRTGYAALRRQMYGYGTGLTAHVTKLALTRPAHVARLAARAPASARMLLSPTSVKNAGKSAAFPPDLSRTELRGILAGPWLYVRSRAALRGSR